jgi:toxin ParE1/3/4
MSAYALHPEAFTDLDQIRAYIAKDDPDAADRVITEIFERFRKLAPLPHQGHRRPARTSSPLRFTRIYDHLIAYAPNENPLWIIAVLHGRRDPKVLAAILGSRS